jgi:hypothetical protein
MAVMPLQNRQDSAKFKAGSVDNTVRGDMEGGYAHTRRRHTRKPRRKLMTGFTELTQAEWLELEAFWDEHGTHTIFDYTHPTTGVLMKVRFTAPPDWIYIGVGGQHKYNLDQWGLEEV